MRVSEIDMVKEAALSAVLYFDVFDYPLLLDQIVSFCPSPISAPQIQSLLQELVKDDVLQEHQGYYARQNCADLVHRRLKCEARAQALMQLAIENGRLIEAFPFVSAVFLSGSISKMVMHEESDIDFFVVARHGRLWVSKLFLKMYKVFALGNSKKHFCMNYFLSDTIMEIQERSIFTAVELVTLVPVSLGGMKGKLLLQNKWYADFLPNFLVKSKDSSLDEPIEKNTLVTMIERIFTGGIGAALDHKVMQFARWRNQRKYSHLASDKDHELMFRAVPNQAKVHTSNHHRKILDQYESRLKACKIKNPAPVL